MFDSPFLMAALGLFVGAGIGFMSGLFAIGGAMIAIPVLGVVFGMNQQLAQGTALAMVAPNVCLAFWKYAQRNAIDVRTAVILAVSATPFTMLFAHIATLMSPQILRLAFVAMLFFLVLELLRRNRVAASLETHRNGGVAPSTLPTFTAIMLGIAAGAVSGLFGAGGAIVAVAALTSVYGFSQTMAQGISLAYVAPGTIASLWIYAGAHDVHWAMGLPLAVGSLFTITPGVVLAHRLPEQRLQQLFAGMLVVSMVALLLRAYRLG